mmetsp:Transcript_37108/g.54566  ORF Transcript_37108/g.54566 Transcript_37108/m.54566 type:complete len:383 (+) Transcript_37108:67-1215(+)
MSDATVVSPMEEDNSWIDSFDTVMDGDLPLTPATFYPSVPAPIDIVSLELPAAVISEELKTKESKNTESNADKPQKETPNAEESRAEKSPVEKLPVEKSPVEKSTVETSQVEQPQVDKPQAEESVEEQAQISDNEVMPAKVKKLSSGKDGDLEKRAARKRNRERERRENVNKQFDELASLLQKIAETDEKETSTISPSKRLRSSYEYSSKAFKRNRADLILETINVLHYMRDEQKAQKDVIKDLNVKLAEEAKKNTAISENKESIQESSDAGSPSVEKKDKTENNMVMMVPMMMPPSANAAGLKADPMATYMAQFQMMAAQQMQATMMKSMTSKMGNNNIPFPFHMPTMAAATPRGVMSGTEMAKHDSINSTVVESNLAHCA